MLKRHLLILGLFVSFNSNAQIDEDSTLNKNDSIITDTFNFDLTNYQGKGELTFKSQKSQTTGGIYQISLKTGEWEYYDDNEILRIKGNYKVNGTQSDKSGRWEYYDDEGELIMVISFPPLKFGIIYLKPFVIKTTEGLEIINYNDDDVLEMKRYTLPKQPSPISTTYYLNYDNDSLHIFNYDTLVDMDNRNKDTWLIADPANKNIDEAKNLVENGSFENEDGKLKFGGLNIKEHIDNWIPSAGTPDYFKSKQFNAADGNAAVGVRFYTLKWSHIEFISTQLKEPMVANKIYCLKVYIRLKEDCFFGVNALGALLSDKIPKANALIQGDVSASIMHHRGSILAYKTKWMLMSCNYTAKGNEEFLTLGSFANSDTMQKKHLKGNETEAYYYFDNIQLYEIEKPEECPCNIGKKEEPPKAELPAPVEPKTFVIRNIFFENDKWNLLPESFTALDSLYDVIDENGFKKIEISGHTSMAGSRERNLLLSKNRAEAVKKYLVKKGLSAKIFVCKGYGPDQPIADNETEEGQAENRRVEFMILE